MQTFCVRLQDLSPGKKYVITRCQRRHIKYGGGIFIVLENAKHVYLPYRIREPLLECEQLFKEFKQQAEYLTYLGQDEKNPKKSLINISYKENVSDLLYFFNMN